MADEAKPNAVDEQKVIGADNAPKSEKEKQQDAAVKEYSRVDASGKPIMQIKIYSPFNDYYDGPAFSLSAENATGPFDILPKHHNFISLLSPCEMIVRTVEKGDQKIKIAGGLMHVKADQVIVFLDV